MIHFFDNKTNNEQTFLLLAKLMETIIRCLRHLLVLELVAERKTCTLLRVLPLTIFSQ